jgi:hypothetical protein
MSHSCKICNAGPWNNRGHLVSHMRSKAHKRNAKQHAKTDEIKKQAMNLINKSSVGIAKPKRVSRGTIIITSDNKSEIPSWANGIIADIQAVKKYQENLIQKKPVALILPLMKFSSDFCNDQKTWTESANFKIQLINHINGHDTSISTEQFVASLRRSVNSYHRCITNKTAMRNQPKPVSPPVIHIPAPVVAPRVSQSLTINGVNQREHRVLMKDCYLKFMAYFNNDPRVDRAQIIENVNRVCANCHRLYDGSRIVQYKRKCSAQAEFFADMSRSLRERRVPRPTFIEHVKRYYDRLIADGC